MNSYTRYVLRQLFAGMILVSAGLTCIIWLSQSLRFVEMIVNRGLNAGTFVYMTMLLLPNFLTVILPIALFTVIVFTYSKMVTDRELVVMRAAGVGQFGLAKPALIITFLTLLFGYVLNLYLLPESYRAFRILQWEIRNTYSHVLLKEGAFNPVTSSVTVYVRERAPDGQLLGILVHDEREDGAPVTLMAERGALVDTGNGPRVVMYNGNRQMVGENAKLSILYFDRYVFEVPTSTESLANRFREPRERSMSELINLKDAKAQYGIITAGGSVDAAVWWFVALERCCQSQLVAEAAGTPIEIPEDLCQSGYDAQGHDLAGWFQFQPWWDELCRDEPEFLN